MDFVEKDGAVIFNVHVVARASRSDIVGEYDGALKARIASPPVDGAANAELIKLLARSFGVPKAQVEIISGTTSTTKRVRIDGSKVTVIAAILKANS